jgi:trans-aconitate 2-methyltransferase
MPWNPEKYHQFQKERSAPFEDLFRMIDVRPGLEVIDLGCGTGELTRKLAERLPGSQVLGIDSSPEMLESTARQDHPRLRFEQGQIQDVQGSWDLIFSNAALQWVGDHQDLIPRLFSLLRPGGQIVVQLPSNHNHISHQTIVETASEEPYRQSLQGWQRPIPVLSIEAYASLLFQVGGQELVVFEKVYPHVLADADAVADWVSGTALVPYLERLKLDLREPFLERLREKLRRVWPEGPVFYGFRRTLFSAKRAAV